jgi:hypothetical protein
MSSQLQMFFPVLLKMNERHDNLYKRSKKRLAVYNMGFAIAGVSCFADTFVKVEVQLAA